MSGPRTTEDEPHTPADRPAATDGAAAGRSDSAAERIANVDWSALPGTIAEEDLVTSEPTDEPAPDERRPPPETIWGAI